MARRQKIYVGIEGHEEIIKILENIGIEANKVLDEAAKEAGELVLQDARNRVPIKTGNLKESLYVTKPRKTTDRLKKSSSVSIGIKKGKKGQGAFYGPFVELGHKTSTGKHIPAKPFLRPAIDYNKKRLAEAINTTISKALRRAGL